ncbi:MAG: 3-phosphoshikimate 1-carboxyvinyltransferase, partial [Veillonella sp.]|nr:3-phosphoshikimate 1-carboxyvinyltransferase [Veillonella sp.]
MHTVTAQVPTGTIAAIPAKAHAHRAIICAALASSGSTIHLSRTSKDIDATMASMRALGAQVDYQDQVITIEPGPAPSKGQILPHESGTTLRLLLPVAASICPEVDV